MLDLVEGDAHDVALERRDPLELPALGVGGDRGVELVAVRLDARGELPREGPRLGEQLLERTTGDIALVAGEDGVAALV